MKNIKIKEVPFGSKAYRDTIKLREEYLRKPLGLTFSKAQLDAEADDHHLALFSGNTLIGCLVLSPQPAGSVRMRQVIIHPDYQVRGLGSMLVKYAETFSRKKGFRRVYCHARDLSVPFYKGLQYEVVGNAFKEMTILHFRMEKELV